MSDPLEDSWIRIVRRREQSHKGLYFQGDRVVVTFEVAGDQHELAVAPSDSVYFFYDKDEKDLFIHVGQSADLMGDAAIRPGMYFGDNV